MGLPTGLNLLSEANIEFLKLTGSKPTALENISVRLRNHFPYFLTSSVLLFFDAFPIVDTSVARVRTALR